MGELTINVSDRISIKQIENFSEADLQYLKNKMSEEAVGLRIYKDEIMMMQTFNYLPKSGELVETEKKVRSIVEKILEIKCEVEE